MIDEKLQQTEVSRETVLQVVLKPQKLDGERIVTYFLKHDMLLDDEIKGINAIKRLSQI